MRRISDRLNEAKESKSEKQVQAPKKPNDKKLPNNSPFNPGNALLRTGIMNHYTPIQNILTNIRNLYCVQLGIAAELGEDNVSIKLSSSRFTSPQKVNELLFTNLYYDVNYQQSCLSSYIQSQGLTKMTQINLGAYYIVYFSPTDIAIAQDPVAMAVKTVAPSEYEGEDEECDCCGCCGCCESSVNEEEQEQEIKKITLDKIVELINSKDKVRAAKQLELLVSQEIQLPREFYFAAIKFKTEDTSIALRWRYTKKLPTGSSIENTRSIMHIFGTGDKAIWIQDYDKDSIVKLPEDITKLIDSILEILDAEKTDDPSIFKMTGEGKKRDKDEDDEDKDEENDEEKDKESEDKDKESEDKDKKDDKKSDEDDDDDDGLL